MINNEYDWEAFINIGLLQQSRIKEDQERLTRLLMTLGSSCGWRVCASFLLRDDCLIELHKQSHDIALKDFFCFRGIEEYINRGYIEENNKAYIEQMHHFIIKWIETYVYDKCTKKENFIRNKCIQIMTKVAIIDYPTRWPSFFKDLICILNNSSSNSFIKDSTQKSISNCGSLALEFFLKFLIYWDCEVCSREVQTHDLIERNTVIKDWMRDNDIVNIMEIVSYIITDINMHQPSLFKKALKVASLYIFWIDIRLLVTDYTLDNIMKPLLPNYNADDNVKSAALNCVINVINKGMSVNHKLELVTFLYHKLTSSGVWEYLEKAKHIPDQIGQEFECDEDDNDNCFYVTLGNLVNVIGMQFIELFKSLKEDKSDQLNMCMDSIYKTERLALTVISCKNSVIGSTCLAFIQNFISLLKLNYKPDTKKTKRTSRVVAQLNEEETVLTDNCLTILTERMHFPSWYNFEKEDEAEGNFQQYRRQLLTIVTNMIQLNEHIVLKYIVSLLRYTIMQCTNIPYQTVEAVLRLIYNVADAVKCVKGDFFVTECSISCYMKEMMQLLVTSEIGRHYHAEVRIVYFEVLLRYEKYFNHEKEYLMNMVYLFLSDSGLKSRELRVVTRCVYIFSRIIKIHKSKFAESSIKILQEISSILQCSFANNSVIFCDNLSTISAYSYLFESAATLLVSSNITNHQQMFHELIKPIVEQVPNMCHEWSLECHNVSHPARANQLALGLNSAATHINYTCKAFGGSASMSELHCLEVYMSVLDIFIRNLQHAFNNSKGSSAIGRDKINSGLRSLIHMLCKCAQHDPVSIDSVLQRLSHAIELFLGHLSLTEQEFMPLCVEIEEIMSLFIQIFHVFKSQSVEFMKGSLWTLLTICDNARKAANMIDFNHNDNLVEQEVTDNVRQLSRLYTQVVSSDLQLLVVILLPDQLMQVLSCIIESIQNVEKPDAMLIKLCCQLFNKVITNLSQLNIKQNLKDTILYELIYKRLLPVLIFMPSHEKFNLTDAQFNLTLSEIAICQKSMALHGGAPFIQYLQTQCLPELRFNSLLIMQYCQALDLQEKEYQAFLKNFYLQARSR